MQRNASADKLHQNYLSDLLPMSNDMVQLQNLIPNLKKRDAENMQPDERDDQVEYSEQLTVEWTHAFLDEMYRIDDFFKKKQVELINQFIGLQDKFRIRTEKYEANSEATKRSKRSKRSNPSLSPNSSIVNHPVI